ncbi:MAG: HAMP domain-containing sensor histidine kinase [Gammaproteobacteria bacterium]
MLPANVFSGGAFRSALLFVLAFLVVQVVTGVALYYTASSALYDQLEGQISEEALLFQQIYARGGRAALADAVGKLESPALAGDRAVGLFDQQGLRIAGNLDLAPDYLGWRTTTFDRLLPHPHGEYRLYATSLDAGTVVVGRNTRFIQAAVDRLLFSLVLAGLAVTVTSLLIGYWSSRQMLGKLEILSTTLEMTSQGDTAVRIPVSGSNDQIDHIASRINLHLDRLALLNDATRNTITSIAHDLRSPLTRAFILLQEAAADDNDRAAAANKLEQASAELLDVTETFDAILRIARIEASTDQQGFAPLAATALVDEMVETFEPVLEAAGQRLTALTPAGPGPTLFGDRRMLCQLLANLIENASRHCPPGAQVRVATTVGTDGGAVLSVADNGPGIPAASCDEVLKPFHRLDASRSTPGTGLGLALVNAIALRHGARISLDDNRPGLLFSIAFPPVSSAAWAGTNLAQM